MIRLLPVALLLLAACGQKQESSAEQRAAEQAGVDRSVAAVRAAERAAATPQPA